MSQQYNTAQYYVDKLDELKTTMNVSIHNLKKSYPLYKIYKTPEYTKIYMNDSTNIETVFHNLYKLQNQLITDSTKKSAAMETNTRSIDNAKKNVALKTQELLAIEDAAQAAKPREHDFKHQLSSTYKITATISIGIVGALIICYKSFK